MMRWRQSAAPGLASVVLTGINLVGVFFFSLFLFKSTLGVVCESLACEKVPFFIYFFFQTHKPSALWPGGEQHVSLFLLLSAL